MSFYREIFITFRNSFSPRIRYMRKCFFVFLNRLILIVIHNECPVQTNDKYKFMDFYSPCSRTMPISRLSIDIRIDGTWHKCQTLEVQFVETIEGWSIKLGPHSQHLFLRHPYNYVRDVFLIYCIEIMFLFFLSKHFL